MELVKNIYFNTDKLIEGNTVKISYTGFFFQTNCEKVFLHFGFGNSWDGLKDVEMKKTALGFQASIELTSNEDLNMCFRNEKEDWDNNFGQNFSFKVIKKPEVVALMVPEEDPFRYPVKLSLAYVRFQKFKLSLFKGIRFIAKLFNINKDYLKNEI